MTATLAIAAPAHQDAAAAAQDKIIVTGEKKKDPNKRVCKRSVPTGSLMPKVTCRTAGEWEFEAEKNANLQVRLKRDQEGREAMIRARDEAYGF
ncbi:MAG: hypothetical protein EOP59_06185 [Sphingomonadales bacterium]|nr:MAG: hypothetical protein EOP59_06185 [Sphingomonadales bacterium]